MALSDQFKTREQKEPGDKLERIGMQMALWKNKLNTNKDILNIFGANI